MVATTNKGLEQPARGSLVGVWDTPVNNNMTIIDNSFGGATTVALLATNVALSSAQYQNAFITFTGTITANIVITFPSIGSFYTVQNLTLNSSSFTVTAQTTAAGGQAIGLPPGEARDIFTDGTNVKFRNLPHVGSYWDYCGSSVPAWVSACTVPPWLYCNASTFSSATYPQLATFLGTTTLPDARGRTRFSLNDTTSRLTSTGGIDGNTRFAAGGTGSGLSIAQANLPNIAMPLLSTSWSDTRQYNVGGGTPYIVTGGGPGNVGAGANATVATLTVDLNTPTAGGVGFAVITNGSTTPLASVSPGYVGGITMIRAG